MNVYTAIGLFVTLAAVLSYVNARWIKLPAAIGLMVLSMGLSLLLLAAVAAGIPWFDKLVHDLAELDFRGALLDGMLCVLLFAGALHVDLEDLRRQKWVVALLSTAGVVISIVLVGLCLYLILPAVGMQLPLVVCFLFGAIIAPTDPVAVLSLMKSAGAPETLKIKITGESLFNDGVGLVAFLVLSGMAFGGAGGAGQAGVLFLQEAVGGIVLGLVLGWIAYRAMRHLDDYGVEILITLAVVFGGATLASALHTSGPLAVVSAGLLLGNHGRSLAMSPRTRQRLDEFWELMDEVLNAILFVWIGLELAVLSFSPRGVLVGLMAIPLALAARGVAVQGTVSLLSRNRPFSRGAVPIITWAGLRGGISVALGLSLPPGEARQILLPAAYMVIVFSILVQGLTLPALIRRFLRRPSLP